MNKTNGWISLHRKIIESPIWSRPAEWSKIWIYLLLEVDHTTGKGFFKWEDIMEDCKVSRQQLKDCLNFLEAKNQITREKLPRGTEITILNWLNYQNKKKTPSKTPTETPTKTPTEIGNETSNEAEQKDIEISEDPKQDPIKKDIEDPTHNTIISNNNYNNLNNNISTIVSKDTETKLKVKDETQIKATELIKEFCLLRGIPLDSGFFSKNIRAARSLVNHYEIETILAGVSWRLQNDENNFWINKLWTLNSVYSYIAQWIAEASQKPHPKTFTDWLDKNPDCDYRKLYDSAEIKSFFIAFNRAIKDGVTMTPEEWGKYNKARKLNKGGK